MRLTAVSIAGFGSYQKETHLDLSAVDVCAVTGPNGSGKSTLFDGVLWALYGAVPGRKLEELHTEGADIEMRARAVFAGPDGRHEFTRIRKLSTGKASAEYQGPLGSERGARAVSEAAARLLGCQQDILALTALSRQGESGRLGAMRAAELRDALADMLIGSRFDAAEEKARAAHQVKEEERTRSELLAEQAAEAAAELPAARTALAEAETARDERREALISVEKRWTEYADLRERLKEAEEAERELSSTHTTMRAARTAEEQAAATLAGAEARSADLAAERDRAAAALSDAAAAAARASERLPVAESAVGSAQKRLDALADDGTAECWVCGSEMPPERRDELAAAAAEMLEALNAERRAAASEAEASQAALGRRKSEQRRAEAAVAQHADKVKSASAALESQRSKLARLSERAEMLQQRAAGAGEARDALRNAPVEAEVRHARKQLAVADQEVGRLRQRRDHAAEAAEAEWGAEAARQDAEEAAAGTGLLKRAMAPAGVPQLALAAYAADLANLANDVLSQLGMLTLRVDHSPTHLAFQARGAWSSAWRDYRTFSGGERMQMDIALRTALTRRAGVRCRTYVLDEGWGALDSERTAAMARFLFSLLGSGAADAYYTISHVAAATDSFRWRIEVTRGPGGSAAALVGPG